MYFLVCVIGVFFFSKKRNYLVANPINLGIKKILIFIMREVVEVVRSFSVRRVYRNYNLEQFLEIYQVYKYEIGIYL